jgi:hypothetical protein
MTETSGRFTGRTAGTGAGLFTRKKTVALLAVYLVLYFATWVGGWSSHARDLKHRAESGYRLMLQNRRDEEEVAVPTVRNNPHFNGHYMYPQYGVQWCVPVVPGVLLANSYDFTPDCGGSGGVKVVLYYGFGSQELWRLWGWEAIAAFLE